MISSHKVKEDSRAAARQAAKDADDLEAAALRAGISVKVPLDESVYDQEISEEDGNEYEDEDHEADLVRVVTEQESATEQLVTAAVNVIRQRKKLLGNFYPFHISSTTLEYIGSQTLVYELCLAIANVNVSINPYKRLQVAFERLAGAVMSIILGAGADFLRTGYPPADSDPPSFEDAIAMLNDIMPDEWVLDPNRKLEDVKDGGIDAVTWKRLDSRTGSIIYVANCGCGSNWQKERKHRERPSEQMVRLLSRPKQYLVKDSFCVPFHINERRDWDDACDQGRLALDRVRLALATERAYSDWAARGLAFEDVRELILVASPDFKPSLRTG